MKCKSFWDGDRLVLVLEGAGNEEDEKMKVMNALKSVYPDIDILPPPDALPALPSQADAMVYVETSYFKGDLEGIYPLVDSMAKENELLASLGKNADLYLSYKFSKMDAEKYEGKLNDVQKKKFFETYAPYLPEELILAGSVAGVIRYYQS